eukprot:Skav203239  [mRNA]  locus=scaffold2746:168753:170348:- [translate_table: standard]
MLVGNFSEANQVQQGQPIEMAASAAAVHTLLEYIYGEEPQIQLEDSFELLHLADRYNFQELAATIEAGLRAALDSAPVTVSLKILQQPQTMHELKAVCEQKVAEHFELCIEHADFLELDAAQLGRILRRQDLRVPREELVVRGLFRWFNRSTDQEVDLAALACLLQHVDFQSLSSNNLVQLRSALSELKGVGARSLDREVTEAMEAHKKRSATNTPETFRAKRRCLRHWSPGLGASAAPVRVLAEAFSMCLHEGALYHIATDGRCVFRWKVGESERQIVAGPRANIPDSLGVFCRVSVSPEGKLFLGDVNNRRLLSFENGSGNIVLRDVEIGQMCCPASGILHLVTQSRQAVQRLVRGALETRVSSQNLPAELHFEAYGLFVTDEEVVYISDRAKGRILRLKPGVSEPEVVGEAPNKQISKLNGLFVTQEEKVYVVDMGQRKVWAFHLGDAAWTEVLTCPGRMTPRNVLVQDRKLYVNMMNGGSDANGIYEYLLPPELQLEFDLGAKRRSFCNARGPLGFNGVHHAIIIIY